jgi:uncharacterized protein (TIGR02147 family)
MDGSRNLTDRMAQQFAKGCRLEGEGAEYFSELVALNQAMTPKEHAERYRRITGFRRYRKIHSLEVGQAAYHSHWYIPAIRELAACSDFVGDPAWIAQRLRPKISVASAKRGLNLLLELGLLVQNEKGEIAQCEPLVSTGAEALSAHITTFHRTMLKQASRALEELDSSERDISALTLSVSQEGMAHLKEKVQRFRRELLEFSALESDPNQVVQINFQVFPLSGIGDEQEPSR